MSTVKAISPLPPIVKAKTTVPSPKRRGEGTSCHHCKKRVKLANMLKCTRGEMTCGTSRKRKRACVKKYCLHCVETFYNAQYLQDFQAGNFICPACRDECRCAACRRRIMKARLKSDDCKLENEASTHLNLVLESETPDANNIEEGQVNGLLEILDARPDVQDIIRRGMTMDFADDNAKILYVGHLIDQALTRPDVLALYYANSNCPRNKIKNEKKKPRKVRKSAKSKKATHVNGKKTSSNSLSLRDSNSMDMDVDIKNHLLLPPSLSMEPPPQQKLKEEKFSVKTEKLVEVPTFPTLPMVQLPKVILNSNSNSISNSNGNTENIHANINTNTDASTSDNNGNDIGLALPKLPRFDMGLGMGVNNELRLNSVMNDNSTFASLAFSPNWQSSDSHCVNSIDQEQKGEESR